MSAFIFSMNLFRLLLPALLLVACNTMDFNQIEPEPDDSPVGTGNVTLCITQLQQEQMPTHINYAFYDMGGTRIKQVNQKLGDNHYGTANVQLDPGTYQVVVLAHSSDRNPTMTNPAKIQFSNAYRYTETFLHYTRLTVTAQPQTLDLTLDRIVSMCRFIINDPIPDTVTRMQFVYKGGSGHFSALTGLGVTKSTQTVTAPVQPGTRYSEFHLYTFLHDRTGQINLTATAVDSTGTTVCQWEYESLPMARNQITGLVGCFFQDADPSETWRMIPTTYFQCPWDRDIYYTY